METFGFDLVPRIANTPEDKARWARLLARVKQNYVFWPDDDVIPKADHIAVYYKSQPVMKIPKDGSKFRRLGAKALFPRYRVSHGSIRAFISVVEKYAAYELGFGGGRAKSFSTLSSIAGRGGATKSIYSGQAGAGLLAQVNSTTTVDWSVFGPEPDATGWNELAEETFIAWHPSRSLGAEVCQRSARRNHYHDLLTMNRRRTGCSARKFSPAGWK